MPMKTEDNDIPKSHDGPRRGIGILLVILTLCCVSFVSILLGPSLLDRASVVLEFESQHLWMPRKLNDGVPVIATLSDTTWLVGQLDTNGNLVMQYKMERLEFNPSRRFANAQLESVLNQNGTLVGDMEPSPDGRWVLGTLFADPTPWSPAWRVATSIDGSHITRWSANLPEYSYAPVLRSVNGSYIAWMPDSRNVGKSLPISHPPVRSVSRGLYTMSTRGALQLFDFRPQTCRSAARNWLSDRASCFSTASVIMTRR